MSENTLYGASITSGLPNYTVKEYVGVSAPPWKTRHANHKTSFKYRRCEKTTEPQKEVWRINDQDGDYNINWRAIGHAAANNPTSKRCNLCIAEKIYIAENAGEHLLNQRDELISKCRHLNTYSLIFHNTKPSKNAKEGIT